MTATAKIDIDFSDAQNRFNVERKLPTSPDDLSNAKIGSMLAGNAAVRYLLLMDSAFVQYELISGIQKSGTVLRDFYPESRAGGNLVKVLWAYDEVPLTRSILNVLS